MNIYFLAFIAFLISQSEVSCEVPHNYSCDFKINVPQNYFATIQLTVNITSSNNKSAPVQAVDQMQNVEQVFSTKSESFYFVSNGGNIKLSTGNRKVQFGFSIFWDTYQFIQTKYLNFSRSATLPPLYSNMPDQQVVITADTRISATIVPPGVKDSFQYLRGVLFFDGTTRNSTYLGTGLQLLTGKSQYVSTSNQMLISYIGDSWAVNNSPIVLQDYENTKSICKFEWILCPDDQDCDGIVSLDGTKGSVALQLYHNKFETSFVLNKTLGFGKLEVFDGGVTKTNLITTYDVNRSELNLPQEFFGRLTTLVFTGETASLTFTRRDDAFDETTSFGRKGFISSDSYGNSFQEAFHINAPVKNPDTIFKVNIATADLSGSTTLIVYCYRYIELTRELSFNSTNLPPLNTTITFHGNFLHIEYYPNGTDSSKLFLNFDIEKSVTRSSEFFFACVIVFLFLF
ncbi:CUB-like domain-containing protein [Caenorhabditis elegans]|uniref:CUB-like domain-containing protein n=1 Tax=Caenorhabditis elegans TaxID=6239 RepID=A5JYV2_CAEEL|nr:CUB-like domain-containing protein [Caenorhabditis elegans]CAN86898.1 CUB-like domain-containing protein [Caenorhabditis elegans]|eukprot:NP_001122870.1 Uncharacterized protein CELE_C29F3.7 [Caenorhabditis elegans]